MLSKLLNKFAQPFRSSRKKAKAQTALSPHQIMELRELIKLANEEFDTDSVQAANIRPGQEVSPNGENMATLVLKNSMNKFMDLFDEQENIIRDHAAELGAMVNTMAIPDPVEGENRHQQELRQRATLFLHMREFYEAYDIAEIPAFATNNDRYKELYDRLNNPAENSLLHREIDAQNSLNLAAKIIGVKPDELLQSTLPKNVAQKINKISASPAGEYPANLLQRMREELVENKAHSTINTLKQFMKYATHHLKSKPTHAEIATWLNDPVLQQAYPEQLAALAQKIDVEFKVPQQQQEATQKSYLALPPEFENALADAVMNANMVATSDLLAQIDIGDNPAGNIIMHNNEGTPLDMTLGSYATLLYSQFTTKLYDQADAFAKEQPQMLSMLQQIDPANTDALHKERLILAHHEILQKAGIDEAVYPDNVITAQAMNHYDSLAETDAQVIQYEDIIAKLSSTDNKDELQDKLAQLAPTPHGRHPSEIFNAPLIVEKSEAVSNMMGDVEKRKAIEDIVYDAHEEVTKLLADDVYLHHTLAVMAQNKELVKEYPYLEKFAPQPQPEPVVAETAPVAQETASETVKAAPERVFYMGPEIVHTHGPVEPESERVFYMAPATDQAYYYKVPTDTGATEPGHENSYYDEPEESAPLAVTADGQLQTQVAPVDTVKAEAVPAPSVDDKSWMEESRKLAQQHIEQFNSFTASGDKPWMAEHRDIVRQQTESGKLYEGQIIEPDRSQYGPAKWRVKSVKPTV